MIILHNSFERYLSSLRNFVSTSIAKHGAEKRHFKNLKKIHFCEIILHKETVKCVDMNKLTCNLLNAAGYLKSNTRFNSNINGNFIINKELYSYLLLEIFKKSSLLVFYCNNYLCIKFFGKSRELSPIINALNAYTLYETKTDQCIIAIPIKKSTEPSVYIESDWEFLFDGFSIVNLIFKA